MVKLLVKVGDSKTPLFTHECSVSTSVIELVNSLCNSLDVVMQLSQVALYIKDNVDKVDTQVTDAAIAAGQVLGNIELSLDVMRVQDIIKALTEACPDYTAETMKEPLTFGNAALWWAGKNMSEKEESVLSDFIGKNEKTKLSVTLQQNAQQPPIRETGISEEMQKQMTAYYYRKQETEKKMAENMITDNVREFEDTSSLKCAFNGIGDVSWKAQIN